MTAKRILVIGAGLSGAVIARALAQDGHAVTVVDQRSHVAGNCHTERDADTGIMVHVYGPHIFHTDDAEVWDYVNAFAQMMPYRHRVKATVRGEVYSLPINLHTINQFFRTAHGPDEAKRFVGARVEGATSEPVTFEDQALRFVGRELYEAFLKGYTIKQWGCHPRDLPASILKRLPLRFTYEDVYFDHRFQGIPAEGYTAMVRAILDHPSIDLRLGTRVRRGETNGYDHVFNSGPLDEWFGHRLGRLGYRTLDFRTFTCRGDHQGCAQMNYGDEDVPFTRVTEHKHFAPWESHSHSVVTEERSRPGGPGDIPFYPIRLVTEKRMLSAYVELAGEEERMTFVGRLGTYRYIDMDVTIREALDAARAFGAVVRQGGRMPVFQRNPLV
ncbi:UDP-galactopyranose/dTDP-fucopyranose mutase family protein [Aquibium microcysteis]|uniref:UDP-galactopyranose/dTDP-fucopyranose mutase family protein n=1 Tax=Aquibium microcysteis TaxID=675281 RepID=UPI00165CF7E5|nr:UDP-galactopyranose mutase [Aquibium microcysteis]